MSPRAARVSVVLVLVLVSNACAQSRPEPPPRHERDGGVAIDQEVMAYLSMARARHHEANLKEEGDAPGAIAALEELPRAPRPHPGQSVPEGEEGLADTFARMAELEVAAGDLARASASVHDGMAHAPDPTYFRGHLLEVAGLTEEARAATLRDAGEPAQAAAAKARALDLLHQAVVVQERVVAASLARGSGSEGGTR